MIKNECKTIENPMLLHRPLLYIFHRKLIEQSIPEFNSQKGEYQAEVHAICCLLHYNHQSKNPFASKPLSYEFQHPAGSILLFLKTKYVYTSTKSVIF